MRLLTGLGLLIGGVLLGLSCTGPTPEAPEAAGTDSRLYHVQLSRTKQKAKANRMLGRALAWWEEQDDTVGPRPPTTDAPSVNVAWRAPLYRVRLGPFGSRQAADSVLAAAQSRFPEAFVRPERVSGRP